MDPNILVAIISAGSSIVVGYLSYKTNKNNTAPQKKDEVKTAEEKKNKIFRVSVLGISLIALGASGYLALSKKNDIPPTSTSSSNTVSGSFGSLESKKPSTHENSAGVPQYGGAFFPTAINPAWNPALKEVGFRLSQIGSRIALPHPLTNDVAEQIRNILNGFYIEGANSSFSGQSTRSMIEGLSGPASNILSPLSRELTQLGNIISAKSGDFTAGHQVGMDYSGLNSIGRDIQEKINILNSIPTTPPQDTSRKNMMKSETKKEMIKHHQ